MTRDAKAQTRIKSLPKLRVGQPFNPFNLFCGIFIPDALTRYQGLSPGAKLAFGRLARYSGEDGDCYPSIPTLGREIGMGTTQARSYVHELVAERFIRVEPRPGTSGIYTFLWHEAFEGDIGKKRKIPPLRKTVGVRPRKCGGPPLRKTGPPPLRKTADEENHHQESQVKESQSMESQPRRFEKRSDLPDQNSSTVDDEKPGEAQLPPWERVRAKFKRANKEVEMRCQDEQWLKENMELRRITPEALLQTLDENPLQGFASPMAGLKWLVKQFQKKTESAADLESKARSRYGCLPVVETTRCEKCGASGRVLEHVPGEQRPRATEEYCDCRMGKELEVFEKRKRTTQYDQRTPKAQPPASGISRMQTGVHLATS